MGRSAGAVGKFCPAAPEPSMRLPLCHLACGEFPRHLPYPETAELEFWVDTFAGLDRISHHPNQDFGLGFVSFERRLGHLPLNGGVELSEAGPREDGLRVDRQSEGAELFFAELVSGSQESEALQRIQIEIQTGSVIATFSNKRAFEVYPETLSDAGGYSLPRGGGLIPDGFFTAFRMTNRFEDTLYSNRPDFEATATPPWLG